MGILHLSVLFVLPGLLQNILLTVILPDESRGGGLCLIRNTNAVRSQVGDQSYRALTFYLNSFIELLGDPHGLLRGEVQDLTGLLLQRGSSEGQRRFAGPLGAADLTDGKSSSFQSLYDPHGLLFIVQVNADRLAVLACHSVVACSQRFGAPFNFEGRIQRPILLRNERIDLVLTVCDHAQRHRLHPAGRESSLHLLP